MRYPLGTQLAVSASAAFATAAGALGAVAWSAAAQTYTFTCASTYTLITVALAGSVWKATASAGGHYWYAPASLAEPGSAPVAIFQSGTGQGAFNLYVPIAAPQLEMKVLTGADSFPGNSTAGAITSSLTGINPGLPYRRIYADIRQPSGAQRQTNFTLNFKLGGSSVGTLQQRCDDGTVSPPAGKQVWYSLGPDMSTVAVTEAQRRMPGSLLFRVQNIGGTGAGYWREIAPIDLTLQIDEILVTCELWGSNDTSTASEDDIHIVLFCLSSAHPF